MKIGISGIIHAKREYGGNGYEYKFWPCDMSDCGYIPVMSHAFMVDIPDDFNPVPAEIEALRKVQQGIRAEAQVKCNAIDEQIGNLLALEHKE